MKYFGFDIEDSGLDPNQHEILSIGCYADDVDPLYLTIRYDSLKVSTASMTINGLDPSRGKYVIQEADQELAHWIRAWAGLETVMPVGFRVESHDMKFLEKKLPRTMQLLMNDTHGQDLNAMIRYLAEWGSLDFKKLKAHLKQLVREKLGDLVEHNAQDDAREAFEIWKLFISGDVANIEKEGLV